MSTANNFFKVNDGQDCLQVSRSGITTAAITATGLITANAGLTVSGAPINLGNNSNPNATSQIGGVSYVDDSIIFTYTAPSASSYYTPVSVTLGAGSWILNGNARIEWFASPTQTLYSYSVHFSTSNTGYPSTNPYNASINAIISPRFNNVSAGGYLHTSLIVNLTANTTIYLVIFLYSQYDLINVTCVGNIAYARIG